MNEWRWMMKRVVILLIILFSSNLLYGQYSDAAENYSTWANESNEGYRFQPWNLYTSENAKAGNFLGSSHAGLIDTDNKAFGMWAEEGYYNAERYFSQDLRVDDKFEIDLSVHWRDGNRGIDLFNNIGENLWNFNINNDGYGNTSWGWQENSSITLTATQISLSQFKIDLIRNNDNASWSSSNINGVVAGFKAYVGDTGGGNERNFYINNLKIRYPDGSLPVTLSAFTAKALQGNVILEWETSAEIENQGFLLSREEQGTSSETVIASFATVDALKGQGTTTETTKYAYTDKSVEPGKTYVYTLADVDYAGNETVLEKVEVTVEAEGAMLTEGFALKTAYPNPFNPSVTLSYQIPAMETVTFLISDLSGRTIWSAQRVHTSAGTFELTWNGYDLKGAPAPSGLYILKMNAGEFRQAIKLTLVR